MAGVCVFLCEQAASKTKHSNVMKWELETGITSSFLVWVSAAPLLPFISLSSFYSVISIFYLQNFTQSPNKTFPINFSNSFHPITARFLSGTFAKRLLDVVGKLGKSDLYPFIPSQLQLLILVLCLFVFYFLLFPSFSTLQLPATSANLVLCNSPDNGTSHSHPESTLYLLSPTSIPPHPSTVPEKSLFYLVTKSSTYNSLIIISKSLQEYRMIIVWFIATKQFRTLSLLHYQRIPLQWSQIYSL